MALYLPPTEDLGKSEIHNSNWTRLLSKYKGVDHDPKWVYMYVNDFDGHPLATVIYDRFPKAMVHLLVIPVNIDVSRPDQFRRRHLPLLKQVHTIAKQIARTISIKLDIPMPIMGYHAIPSMADIHLHIISTDFDSPFLKRAEHYKSFTDPDYFLSPEKIESNLINYDFVHIISSDALKRQLKYDPLMCLNCGEEFTSLKDLKMHLGMHN